MGAVADDYALGEELLDEAVEKARDLGASSAMTLLERARDEAQKEYRRVVQEQEALEPEPG